MFNDKLRIELLDLEAVDQRVRTELAADGSLFQGYDPRMEAVHRANATRLCEIIDMYGWPGQSLVGDDGANAAWLIAQHAIGEPERMRAFRSLIDRASQRDDCPRWHFAYIDDRIRVLEGRAQRYGTQLQNGPLRVQLCEVEDPERLDERRRDVGLPPIAVVLDTIAVQTPEPVLDRERKQAEEIAWKNRVGWIPEMPRD